MRETAEDRFIEPRRAWLLRALALGVVGAAPGAHADVLGKRPGKLPPGRSIWDVQGAVTVAGKPATLETRVNAGDVIETGPGASIVFAVGADAFMLREKSRMETRAAPQGAVIDFFRLATGAVLSVFGSGRKQFAGTTATIGIRGTGVYLKSDAAMTYVCTCYGATDIAALDDPKVTERIVSRHHDAPRFIYGPGERKRIEPAPFMNHTDLELALIEALVGRAPPFALFDEGYGGNRRY
ncbi:MAG: hypothetical protein MUF30_12450 [Burkholderiales bacterium]|jgi:hypothetical protein|nr:hypothetical protein [Burkholderiales bacterium]